MELEKRTFLFEIRADKDSRKMIGHAAVFNEETTIGGYIREKIRPGAFAESIQTDDVRALFNHNPDYVLGRNISGTLRMHEDARGLWVEIDPPDTQFARDLSVSIARGDISQMSFAFEVMGVEWQEEKDKLDLRIITKVKLYDVSPVTYPAYEGTDIAMRSHEAWQKQNEPPKEEIKSNIKRRRILIRRNN